MECFSTADLPVQRKLSYWNEVAIQTFTALEVVPGDPQQFEGRLYRQELGNISVVDVTTSPGQLRHTRTHIARGLGERFTLLVGLGGHFHYYREREGSITLGVGDLCLLDQSHPYELRFDGIARTFCVVLPHALLGDLLLDPDRHSGRVIHAGNASTRVLGELARAFSYELEQGDDASLTPQMARGLTGFIAAALENDGVDERAAGRAARRQQVLRYVDQRLHDPQLRPAVIARHFGISERSLRLLFAGYDEGLANVLLRRRLEACAALLRAPAWRQRTITEIALRHGFNNPTHFGHAFKRRFGVTPREYRRLS